MIINSLYRYPVKGLSAQKLEYTTLRSGNGFPFDRLYALTDGTWTFDPEDPTPQPKTKFLALMRHERLAKLSCEFDEAGHHLRIFQDGNLLTEGSLVTTTGRTNIEKFFATYLKEEVAGNYPAVAHKNGHVFTDVSVVSPALMNSISLINLATLRQLEEKIGRQLNPLRFRANIYFEGPAGDEQNWIDREIVIGNVRAKVNFKTKRCAATNVNPISGERDERIPNSLLRHFGHMDLGVYAEILSHGEISAGQEISI